MGLAIQFTLCAAAAFAAADSPDCSHAKQKRIVKTSPFVKLCRSVFLIPIASHPYTYSILHSSQITNETVNHGDIYTSIST